MEIEINLNERTLLKKKIDNAFSSKNTSAFYLYKSIGFEIEGCLKKHVKTKNGLDDVFRMAIFNSNENK